ncbi:aspartate aminotransferase family protein [Bradyrhizobium sp. BR 1432]|uniref:aspartate aminotransferase family protein n=1 Tax=Bradyrhizobium sp. BR 1432 TaxID=3447966 RepID=UPI003EE78EB0
MYCEARSISVRRQNSRSPSVVRGSGCYLYDSEGKAYLDMSGGSGAANLGYGRQEIIQAIQRQSELLIHTGWNIDNPHRHSLVERLARLVPFERASVMGAVTGAEGIEVALKIARAKTGRSSVLYFSNAFHGKTQGALAVSSNKLFRKHVSADAVDYPSVSLESCYADLDEDLSGWSSSFRTYLDALKARRQLPAAIIVEPIQAAEGIHALPFWTLETILQLGIEYGVITIFDEIYTGFGRTGSPFVSRPGMLPDLLVVGKALGNGLPISAIIGDPQLVDLLTYSEHSSTFTFMPLACAVACTVADLYLSERPWENADRIGGYLRSRLKQLAQEDPRITLVRGRGLMLACDVNDREGAQQSVPISVRLREKLEELGVIVRTGGQRASTVKMTPPLTITKAEIDKFVSSLSHALSSV